jgi:glycosyltransferase involved in cell wall biosynthesis
MTLGTNSTSWAAGRPQRTFDAGAGADLVSVVCVTNRLYFADRIVGNYLRQRYEGTELVLVLNRAAPVASYEALFASVRDVRLVLAPDRSVGRCRNEGVAAARGKYVVMFDDDDLYGRDYVAEGVATLRATGAEMVAKEEYLWVDGTAGVFWYRRGDGEYADAVPNASANTQIFLRSALCPDDAARPRYADTSLGEDLAFSEALVRAGGRIVSSSRFNFVRCRNVVRGQKHLWDGTFPGFDLADHPRLDVDIDEVLELAQI